MQEAKSRTGILNLFKTFGDTEVSIFIKNTDVKKTDVKWRVEIYRKRKKTY